MCNKLLQQPKDKDSDFIHISVYSSIMVLFEAWQTNTLWSCLKSGKRTHDLHYPIKKTFLLTSCGAFPFYLGKLAIFVCDFFLHSWNTFYLDPNIYNNNNNNNNNNKEEKKKKKEINRQGS